VLVEINDNSLGGDNAWPWSAMPYALFLQAALPLSPAVVTIEPVLNWDNDNARGAARLKAKEAAKALHDFILQAPKLVLASRLGPPADPEVVPTMQPAPFLRNVKGDVSQIPVFADIEQQAADDLRLLPAIGFANIPPLPQGRVTHEAPLVFNYRGEIVPSLVLQTLILWFKLSPDDVVVEPGLRIELGKEISIPIDAAGRMKVNFNAPFTRFGFDDLLLAVEEKQEKRTFTTPIDTVKGGILLLARTDAAARTLRFPSLSAGSPGELCARALATALTRGFSHRVTHWFDFAVIAGMMALSALAHRFKKGRFALWSFVGLLAYLFLCLSMYTARLTLLPIVMPVGLLLLVNFFSAFSHREASTPKA
jgi:hypothetical protein